MYSIQEPFYFSDTTRKPVAICGHEFQRLSYDRLESEPFWSKAECMDVLMDLDYSNEALSRLSKFKYDFACDSSGARELSGERECLDNRESCQSDGFSKPSWFVNRSHRGILADLQSGMRARNQLNQDIYQKMKTGYELFSKNHPEIDMLLKYAEKSARFIHNQFRFDNFSTTSDKSGPLMCYPDTFIERAQRAGYRLPSLFMKEEGSQEPGTQVMQPEILSDDLPIEVVSEVCDFYSLLKRAIKDSGSAVGDLSLAFAEGVFRDNESRFEILEFKHLKKGTYGGERPPQQTKGSIAREIIRDKYKTLYTSIDEIGDIEKFYKKRIVPIQQKLKKK